MYTNKKCYSSGSTLALQAVGSKPLFPIVTSNSTMLFKPLILSSSNNLKSLPGDLCCLNLSQILLIYLLLLSIPIVGIDLSIHPLYHSYPSIAMTVKQWRLNFF